MEGWDWLDIAGSGWTLILIFEVVHNLCHYYFGQDMCQLIRVVAHRVEPVQYVVC